LIKILGSKTTFEVELDLFEFQTGLEKSGKFHKFLTCLGLPECEFRLHRFMVKFAVFIQAPFDLV
jgi:hypothetical protein